MHQTFLHSFHATFDAIKKSQSDQSREVSGTATSETVAPDDERYQNHPKQTQHIAKATDNILLRQNQQETMWSHLIDVRQLGKCSSFDSRNSSIRTLLLGPVGAF